MSEKVKPKLVIDENIPFARGVLEPHANVTYVQGASIDNEMLRDADALLIRTRTRCDEALLKGTSVKFIGSATIGTDHIDESYCHTAGIKVASAPGCNAGAVAQYIASALVFIAEKEQKPLQDIVLGIVGAGHVGTQVETIAQAFGIKTLLNDPPRQRREQADIFHPLNTLLSAADIITLHVPLTFQGADPTYQMVNDKFLKAMKHDAWLINTSRGEVAGTGSLLSNQKKTILDVWEGEPNINQQMLDATILATPHIAGYSIDGKANGTKRVINAISSFFDLPPKQWSPVFAEPEDKVIDLNRADSACDIRKAVYHTYDIRHDDTLLRTNPHNFEKLRGTYRMRWEFPHYQVKTDDTNCRKQLAQSGFEIFKNR